MEVSHSSFAFRYRAFISYSHHDQAWARWLHKALETYRVPRRLVGSETAAGVVPRRLAPIFRDRDELPSATDLSRAVNEALAASANLIVICSPAAAASRWVNEEVLSFKRLGRGDRIFCVIVDGEPDAGEKAGDAQQECFVPALRFELGADGQLTTRRTEPIAADLRPGKDRRTRAKLKLVAGMLGLGFDALRQRELQRRIRRLSGVTALAVAIMVVTIVLAIAATIARRDAERRQKQAETLVNFMLGDLNDKLAQVQRLDIMQAVDDQAMKYFQSLPTTDVTDEALAQRARAFEKIGSVRLDQGHLPEAMQSYLAATKIGARLADAEPANVPRQLFYAETVAFIGMTRWYQGDLRAAEAQFLAAQRILLRAQTHAASNPQLIFQLATIDNDIGHVREATNRLADASAEYASMLALCQRLVAMRPNDVHAIARLGVAYDNIGKMALMRGDLLEAIANYAADDAIESGLSARDPKNNDQRTNMLRVHAILGRTLALAGQNASGVRDLQEAVATARSVAAVDPTLAGVQEELALYETQLSRLLRIEGDLRSASALTAKALATFARLTAQDPANSAWRREYAQVRAERAAQWLALGHENAARVLVGAALNALRPLARKDPNDRELVLAHADAELLLARLTTAAPAAARLREQALAALRAPTAGRKDPRLLGLQVRALLALERKSEALPLIRTLWSSGYRDPAFVRALRRADIEYPPNAAFEVRLEDALIHRPTTITRRVPCLTTCRSRWTRPRMRSMSTRETTPTRSAGIRTPRRSPGSWTATPRPERSMR